MNTTQKEYFKNTFILFVGKFATQFSSILLLPLFTYYLTTTDYGTIDLIQTYINLFVPVFLLCFDSAIFRYLIDARKSDSQKEKIIYNSIIFSVIQCVLVLLLFLTFSIFINFQYCILTIVNTIILMISSVVLQICRGIGNNRDYSISMICTATVNLLLNIILIIVFKFGGESILVSSIVGNFISISYLFIKCKIYKCFKRKLFKKKIIKELLQYSIPMIPNTLSWWVMNVSDRTIISLFINAAANGIYSISCKFSNIINSIFSIFIMSWQETASIHINDKNCDEVLSEMIERLLVFFITLIIGLTSFIPLIFDFVIGKNYYAAYNYIPILLISNIFSIFTSLLGGIYIAKKSTKEVAKTSLISAIINIVINFLFIKMFGLYAASISTLISYLLMSIYRSIDIKKYITLTLNIHKLAFLSFIVISSTIIYYVDNNIMSLIMTVISLLIAIYMNKDFFVEIKKLLLKSKKKFSRSR